MSSRVPDPTVDRRVSVNSGAAGMGATTLCLDNHFKTQNKGKRVCDMSCTDEKVSGPRAAYQDPASPESRQALVLRHPAASSLTTECSKATAKELDRWMLM